MSKFEEVDESTLEITTKPDSEDMTTLNSTCACEPKNLSGFCNDTKLLNILTGKNSSTFIMTRLVRLDDTLFVVVVSSDFVSVYIYAEEDLRQTTGKFRSLNKGTHLHGSLKSNSNVDHRYYNIGCKLLYIY